MYCSVFLFVKSVFKSLVHFAHKCFFFFFPANSWKYITLFIKFSKSLAIILFISISNIWFFFRYA